MLSLFAKSQALVPTKVAKENATTPLITESVDAEMGQVKDEVEAEDLDTGCRAHHAGFRLGIKNTRMSCSTKNELFGPESHPT